MSDVIWAALIAVLGSGIGSVTTYLVAKRSSATAIATAERTSATAIATAERQAEVDLAKVRSDLHRLRAEHREAERSNRQGTYHRTLAILDRLDMFATGYNPETEAEYMVALEELNNMVGGIHLFGAQPVRDALGPLSELFADVGASIAARQSAGLRSSGPVPYAVAYGEAYRKRRVEIINATAQLTEAMRADVTRDIHDDG